DPRIARPWLDAPPSECGELCRAIPVPRGIPAPVRAPTRTRSNRPPCRTDAGPGRNRGRGQSSYSWVIPWSEPCVEPAAREVPVSLYCLLRDPELIRDIRDRHT